MFNEIRKLITELNEASKAYYNTGNPIMTDEEYDNKYALLQTYENLYHTVYSDSPTQKVGAEVLDKINKVDIPGRPMLSLNKVTTEEEIIKWGQGNEAVCSVKCDGLSTRLIYESGKLISANSRGNGTIGTDITKQVMNFTNVPLEIAKKDRYVIDGESIIKINTFETIAEKENLSSPRNAASGTLTNTLDTSVIKNRQLSFIAWSIIEGYNDSIHTLSAAFEEAETLGFEIVPYSVVNITDDVSVCKENNNIAKSFAQSFNIPTDGVVWTFNDFNSYLAAGTTKHHFKGAVAYKWEEDTYETKIVGIDWSMSRNNLLTPVVVMEPIEIDGAIVSRASAHNIDILKTVCNGNPKIGQPIKVIKAKEIIPQVVWSDITYSGTEIAAPERCPICGAYTEVKKSNDGVSNLYCTNPQCDGAFTHRIDHFVSKGAVEVKGLSAATIRKLIDFGWLEECEDIFKLKEHRVEWINKVGFGEKSVDKILAAIEDAKTVSFDRFLYAIGIPLIGENVAKDLCAYVSSYEELHNLINSNYDFSHIPNFGIEKHNAIVSFDYTEADKLYKYLNVTAPAIIVASENGKLFNKTFVITGKLNHFKNRKELETEIKKNGGRVASSVTSKTDYLIANDEENTVKYKTAYQKGIPIISEDDFLKML